MKQYIHLAWSFVNTDAAAFNPACSIYNQLQHIVNTLAEIFAAVFTLWSRSLSRYLFPAGCGIYKFISMVTLIAILSGCKTPEQSTVEETRSTVETASTNTQKSSIDDTTTIRHTILNDTTVETKIIRRTIYEDHKTAQSLQDSTRTAQKTVTDTLTPELMKKLLKGLKWTCVAAIFIVLAFLFVFALVVYLVTKRG